MSAEQFDLVVIGAGSGGVRAARRAAGLGAKVAVIERSRLGGTCVMRGCVPKKLLVMGADFARHIADAEGFGWSFESVSFDWARLVAAKNLELNRLETAYRNLLAGAGVTLIEGNARLDGPGRVKVGERALAARNILVASGGRPSLPAIPGIERAITSDQALDLMQLPSRLAILGGGYIACEFAFIFATLGVEVSLLIRGDLPLRGFDPDIRSQLAQAMTAAGIRLHAGAAIQAVSDAGVELDGGRVEADLVMAALGRVANTEGLGLREAGVELDEGGHVVVDETFATSAPGIWALGDVIAGRALTPIAIAQAEVLAANLFGGQNRRFEPGAVPTAVFTLPPIATAGLGEHQAPGAAIYEARVQPMRNTLAGRPERAYLKLVVDPATDRVLGLHLMAPDAPEIIQGFAAAINAGITKAQLDATIGLHPSLAEELVTMREKRP
jgi:glutathione reductase (NADPH)